MYKYVLYKTIYEAQPKVVTVDKLPLTGFVSTYMYDSGLVKYVTEHGSLRGFSATKPVCYSETLLVDFDDAKEAARDFYRFLRKKGLKFDVYDSGGRSIHFHIKRHPVASESLPYSDKYYIMTHAPKADLTIYQVGRVFRRAGTIHHKTGRKKELLEKVEGNLLETIITEKPSSFQIKECIDYEGVFNDPWIYCSMMGYSAGERELNIFKLITRLQSLGMSKCFIDEFIRCVNAQSLPPLEEERVDYLLGYYLG